MKKSTVLVIALAVAAGIGAYVLATYWARPVAQPRSVDEETAVRPAGSDRSGRSSPGVTTEGGQPTAEQSEPAKEEPRQQSSHYVKPDETPAFYERFHELSQTERLNKVTEAMHDKVPMAPEVYAFLNVELFNRDHWDVTRNNMANAVVWAADADGQHPDPNLHLAFINMLEDEVSEPPEASAE